MAVGIAAVLDISEARSLRDVNLQTRHWRDIEITTERLLGALRDAETGQRGYLLTRQEEYLRPYNEGGAVVSGLSQQLQTLTATQPDLLNRAQQIDSLTQRKLSELEKTIQLSRSGEGAAALALVKTNQGQLLMDDIRNAASDISKAALNGISDNRARANAATSRLIMTIAGTAVLSIAVLVVLTYLLRRDGRQVRETAEQLDITLRSIGDAVVATDAAGRVTFMNEVATHIGQRALTAHPTLFRDMFRLVSELTGEPAKDPVAQVLRDGKTIALANHTALVRPDGTHVSIEDSAAPLRDESGQIRGVVFVFRDISDRRKAEKELALTQEKLKATVSALQAREAELELADRRKDEFLATLSHELRNPIAPIRHAIQILDQDRLTDEQHQWGRAVIRRQVKHVGRLLDDLLDSTRITRGELSLRVAPVALRSVITEALDIAAPLVERKGHILDVLLPENPLVLQVDGVRLSQALSNILLNAAKYTDPGGRIVVRGRQTTEDLEISVRDSGVGLTAESIPHVFEMFRQIPSSRRHSEGGLGIGLSLSAALVKLHGGQIDVYSAGEGQGSEFVVRLPLSSISDEILPQVESMPVLANSVSPLVLIVDDNRDAAESLAMLLRADGHEVLVTHSGEDGLELARKRQPAVAVIDIGLPGISGYELAQALRAPTGDSDVLLVALTGWGQADDKERAVAAGFDHHLTKPADLDTLLTLIAARCQAAQSVTAN